MVARSFSVMVVVASLFALTQCALDDRDLEVHDGNGGNDDPLCEPMDGDEPCAECTKSECCGEFVDCTEDVQCGYYTECSLSCGPDDAVCEQVCQDYYSDGFDVWNELLGCALDSCLSECS